MGKWLKAIEYALQRKLIEAIDENVCICERQRE